MSLHQEMQAKLAAAGLPYHSLHVFGAIRCNVHVVCLSRETAHKWEQLLARVFRSDVRCVPTRWDAKENKGTSLCPTKRTGWLVAVAA